MSKLSPGQTAPEFSMFDIDGKGVRLSDYRGKKVLLSFFHFATCPFCTVRFLRLAQEAERYSAMGLEVIAVFESSQDYLTEYLGRRALPFPIVPDPFGVTHTQYGVKKSMLAVLLGMLRLPSIFKALLDPEYRLGKPDGSISRIPADFLIGQDGRVADCYYGSDIGDHIPFKRIDDFITEGVGEAA